MSAAVVALVIAAAAGIFASVKRYRADHVPGRPAGYIIVPCFQVAEDLERIVRAYYWEEMFEGEKLSREILLLITEEGSSAQTARRLAQELPIVSAVDISHLNKILMGENVHKKD